MKVSGIFDYRTACNELDKAMNFLDKSKSIEYKVTITIQELDSEYKEYEDDSELTLSEAAKELKLSNGAALRMAIKRGHFKPEEYRLVGNSYLIKESAVERYRKEKLGKNGYASENHKSLGRKKGSKNKK